MESVVKSGVSPSLLVWGRETSGYGRDEVARRLDIDVRTFSSWEDDEEDSSPTVSDLRRLASLYDWPLSLFYLPEPPDTSWISEGFGSEFDNFPSELKFEIRRSKQLRFQALDLYSDIDEELPEFVFGRLSGNEPDEVATEISFVSGWEKEEKKKLSFPAWCKRVEDLGVLVFRLPRIGLRDVNSFSCFYESLPVIVVSDKRSVPHRIFALLYELARLSMGESGIYDSSLERSWIDNFCFGVASKLLLPERNFLSEGLVSDRDEGVSDWTDSEIFSLSRSYNAPPEVVVSRLKSLGRSDEQFSTGARERYMSEDFKMPSLRQEGEAVPDEERLVATPSAPPRHKRVSKALNVYGYSFVHLVIEAYRNDSMTLVEVMSCLGVGGDDIPELERRLWNY